MTHQEIGTLYTTHKDSFARFGYKLTKNKADTMDLLQESAVRALTHSGGIKQPEKFKSWFNTIIYNTFVNEYRAKKRRCSLLNNKVGHDHHFFNQRYTVNDGYEQLKVKDIYVLMDVLGSRTSNTFKLHFEGYSYQDISDIEDIPIGTVKSRIYFVRRKVRKLIAAKNATSRELIRA